MFAVFRSKAFIKKLSKFPADFNKWVEKIEGQLMINPYAGNYLSVSWLREKKRGKFRIYYLIYKELKAVYMVGISDKDDQQRIINTIKLFLRNYREEIENSIRKKNL